MMTALQSVAGWLDPDWFQAIGSVAAIIAGFAYVALQHDLERRREARAQAEMREHAVGLCRSIIAWQANVLRVFEISLMTGTETETYHPPRPITALAMELLAMPVAALGDAKLASSARLVGGNAITVIDIADAAAGKVCTAAVLHRMKDAALGTYAAARLVGLEE